MLKLAKYFNTVVIKVMNDTKKYIFTMNKKIGNLCREIATIKKNK